MFNENDFCANMKDVPFCLLMVNEEEERNSTDNQHYSNIIYNNFI
jgi:hypothetical protein